MICTKHRLLTDAHRIDFTQPINTDPPLPPGIITDKGITVNSLVQIEMGPDGETFVYVTRSKL